MLVETIKKKNDNPFSIIDQILNSSAKSKINFSEFYIWIHR